MEKCRYGQSFALSVCRSAAAVAIAVLLFAPHKVCARDLPLNESVLVVYNSADANSTNVANYYVSKRGIPAANLCPITPPSTVLLSWADFNTYVKTPIRHCINFNALGEIFYIVFTYNTPYKVTAPNLLVYSLDSFIADLWDWVTPPNTFGVPSMPQPYYADSQSQGNVYVPFLALENLFGKIIYSVWRLDAATPALAQGLVDKAMLAESIGLTGQVCIDEQIAVTTYDNGTTGSPDWDLRQAATLARLAGFSVLQDFNAAEFGTSPAPLRCDNAALYGGLYTLNHYNNAFTWNPGAIGFHLESASAYDPRGGTNWSANAVINGITVTGGTMSEPLLGGLGHPDAIFRNLFEGANVGDAVLRNTKWLKWTLLNIGDPLYRPFPAGIPAVTAPQNSLALTPQYLIGGNTSTGTITLAAPAPAGGIVIALKSSTTTIATVPATVTVAAGQTTASFPISTNLVLVDSPLYITATFGTSTLTNTLVPQALLAGLALSPVSVIGGAGSTGYIGLNDKAPSGGITVNVSSNNGAASVPATVPIAEGNFGATFAISSSAVLTATTATISAKYAGATKTANLTVNPLNILSVNLSPTSVTGGVSTTLNKVTMSAVAPADTVVNLSSSDPGVSLPASVTVAAGTSVSPVFTITTSLVSATTPITISASYNGVIKTATLTVSPIVATPSLSPTAVVGGVSTTLNKVNLSVPAPAGGVSVNLTSSDPGVGVPASVTVAAGMTSSPYFTITTSAVSATASITITATLNGVSKTATLTVNPMALLSVALSPTSTVGGTSTTLNKVNLTGAAPAGGISVNLTSSDPGVVVPASVTVAAGATASPAFTITTSAVSATASITITAVYNGVTKTAISTVNPVALLSVTLSPTTVVGGASTTLNKVNLTGPAPAGGISVTLTSSNPGVGVPASVTVAAGATASPTFTITTSAVSATVMVTISATFNSVTKTAVLTDNPVALLSVALSPTTVVGGVSTTLNKVNLTGPAPAGGISVSLTSSNPGVGVPASVTVAAGATASPAFTITTSAVSATVSVTISAVYNGVTKTAILTVNPVALLSVTLSPTTVVGGVSTTLNKVNLNGPAPAGGVSVNLSSSDPGVGVPASVTVPAGATASAAFTITTSAVSATVPITISAMYNGVTKTAILTDNPVALLSVVLSPTTVVGGVSTTLNKVNLNGPAPAGGVSVNLGSSDPGVGVPASVTVAAGATASAAFTITTSAVSATTPITITATFNGVNKTAILTVSPVAPVSVGLSPTTVTGGTSTTLNKVNLNGPAPAGGISVTLTSSDPGVGVPASVPVAAGATSSSYFKITTSSVAATTVVTISAQYNGVTKTANLTVNP